MINFIRNFYLDMLFLIYKNKLNNRQYWKIINITTINTGLDNEMCYSFLGIKHWGKYNFIIHSNIIKCGDKNCRYSGYRENGEIKYGLVILSSLGNKKIDILNDKLTTSLYLSNNLYGIGKVLYTTKYQLFRGFRHCDIFETNIIEKIKKMNNL